MAEQSIIQPAKARESSERGWSQRKVCGSHQSVIRYPWKTLYNKMVTVKDAKNITVHRDSPWTQAGMRTVKLSAAKSTRKTLLVFFLTQ